LKGVNNAILVESNVTLMTLYQTTFILYKTFADTDSESEICKPAIETQYKRL